MKVSKSETKKDLLEKNVPCSMINREWMMNHLTISEHLNTHVTICASTLTALPYVAKRTEKGIQLKIIVAFEKRVTILLCE